MKTPHNQPLRLCGSSLLTSLLVLGMFGVVNPLEGAEARLPLVLRMVTAQAELRARPRLPQAAEPLGQDLCLSLMQWAGIPARQQELMALLHRRWALAATHPGAFTDLTDFENDFRARTGDIEYICKLLKLHPQRCGAAPDPIILQAISVRMAHAALELALPHAPAAALAPRPRDDLASAPVHRA